MLHLCRVLLGTVLLLQSVPSGNSISELLVCLGFLETKAEQETGMNNLISKFKVF